jgi:hypothetical protein
MPKLAINLPLFACCTELLAQQWQHNTPPGLDLNPPGFTVATFGRSVVADLTNHQLPDLVMLATESAAGGREAALLVAAPGIHRSAVVLPNTDGKRVRDIAVIRGGDPLDGRDALALATDLGLFRWLADGSMTRYGGIAWQNATRIDVGDIDGDGIADVIGKMGSDSTGNPQNVRCTSIGGTASWMVDTGAPILDLAAVDWVTNPGLPRDEVAVVHQNAVHFLVDGVLDPNLSVALPLCDSACILPMRTATGDVRLVVGITDAANQSALATITPGDPLLAMRLVGRPIGALTAVDHAGAHGVLVAIADNANLVHFVQDETAFPTEGFAPGNNMRAAAEPANGAAGARLLDLDADGDLDLFSSTAGVGIQISRAPGDDPYCGDRPILIRPPQSIAMTYQLPSWANQVETLHFQFTTAWAPNLTVESIEMDPEGLPRTFAPAGTLYSPEDMPLLGDLVLGPVASAVRAVQRDADGRILRRGPFRIYIEVLHQEERTFLESQFTAGCTANVIVAPVSIDSPLVYSGVAPGQIFAWEKTPSIHFGILPTVVEPPVLPPPKPNPPVPPKGGQEGVL